MQISKAVADKVSVQPSALVAAVAAGIAIHLVFLGFNLTAATAMGLGGPKNPTGATSAHKVTHMSQILLILPADDSF